MEYDAFSVYMAACFPFGVCADLKVHRFNIIKLVSGQSADENLYRSPTKTFSLNKL